MTVRRRPVEGLVCPGKLTDNPPQAGLRCPAFAGAKNRENGIWAHARKNRTPNTGSILSMGKFLLSNVRFAIDRDAPTSSANTIWTTRQTFHAAQSVATLEAESLFRLQYAEILLRDEERICIQCGGGFTFGARNRSFGTSL